MTGPITDTVVACKMVAGQIQRRHPNSVRMTSPPTLRDDDRAQNQLEELLGTAENICPMRGKLMGDREEFNHAVKEARNWCGDLYRAGNNGAEVIRAFEERIGAEQDLATRKALQ